MAVEFRIQRPSSGDVLRSKFTAFGTACLSDGPLSGILVGDKGTAVAGITFDEPPLRLRWSMLFSLEVAARKDETFILHIFGGSARVPKLLGSVASITVGSARTSRGKPPVFAVPIDYPGPHTSHCNETFFAEGSLTGDDTALDYAKVTSMVDPNVFTCADSLPTDGVEYWSALFPVIADLPSGDMYRLDVRGNAGGTASVDNLDIRSCHCGERRGRRR